MTRYRLDLAIRYRFDQASGGGRQVLRVLPAALPGVQSVTSELLAVQPPPQESRRFVDFWGTRAIELVTPPGLSGVEITLQAEIERQAPAPRLHEALPRADLAAALAACRDLGPLSPHHHLGPSPRIPPDAAIAAFAARACAGCGGTAEAALALGEALHAHLRFDAGATDVETAPGVAFAGRHGVCQDFAQIMIAGLRSLGIPAAYCAGYLRTRPPPGQPRLVGVDAMHAWVRFWAGPVAGWIDHDPTNACLVGADHLHVGHGRDYADLAPVTGSLRLAGGQSGSHAVDIEEIDATGAPVQDGADPSAPSSADASSP